jgi:hypothetical protein
MAQQEKAVAGFGPPEDAPGFGPPEDTPAPPPNPSLMQQYNDLVAPLVTPTSHDFLGAGARVAIQPDASSAFKQYGREALREAGTTFSNIGAGLFSVPLHPLDALVGVGKLAIDPFNPNHPVARQLAESLVKQPLETAETMVGQAGATEAAGAALKMVPKALRGGVEIMTKTTAKETADLVKATREGNKAEVESAAAKNTAQAVKRSEQVKAHFQKQQSADAANEAIQTAKDRKVALERGVEHLDPDIKTELEATEKSVNAQANAKYNDLVKVLKQEQAAPYQALDGEGHVVGEPKTITEHLYDVAAEPLRGTETESEIIKSLGKRVQQGETSLTYNDLQGYREEIGKQLRGGKLAPDTFTAYKALMTEIDKAMQEIADRHGLGKAQTDARNFYREYAQAFLDNGSPIRKALDSTERGGVVRAFKGKDQSGVETLAKFNPKLARRVNTVRGFQSEAAKIRTNAQPKAAPPLPPKKPPGEPVVKKLGAEDIRAAKAKGLEHRVNRIRGRGEWIATGAAGYRLLSHILSGKIGEVPKDVFEGGVAVAGVAGFAKLLENPKIQELLTRPTPRDLAQIPPDLRADLAPVLAEAKRQGVKVNPALALLVAGGAPKKKALPPDHPLALPQ